jgi:GTP pyrophosphokinase
MIDKLLNQVSAYLNKQDRQLIRRAYDFAKNAHMGQFRESGEEYLIHPVALAYILADLQFDAVCISAALLHDVVEDTRYTYGDIKQNFGQEIADIVDGLTKISKLEFRTKQEEQAENFRKMLIAMAKDIRVIFIKLADRLHNMRTIKYMPEKKRKEKAQETLDVYAPLAHRLGIFKIKWELEDISFRYLNEEAYYDIVNKVTQNRTQRETYINQFIKMLKVKLKDTKIDFKIEGRAKHFYSIYKKLQRVGNFEQIYDLLAVRILVDDIQSCYAILGVVHTAFTPLPGKFKDYIAMPKPNMYQSLHTTVMGPMTRPVEVQIRTYEMHKVAEYGIAAHWKYKEGSNRGKVEKNSFDEKLAWLRQVMEWNNEVDDSGAFYEMIKGDLFADEVYVFTPQGDVINLPAGSCPLDFAYRIHSDIGNKCVGAKINNKIVPVSYKLKNGDIVEILTSPNSKGPSRDWLKIVQSSNSKNKIRNWFKKADREENILRGKEIIDREIKRMGYTSDKFNNPKYWEYAISKYNYPNVSEMYSAVGYGGIKAGQILRKIIVDFEEDFPIKEKEIIKKTTQSHSSIEKAIKIGGYSNMAVRLAKCCNPVPGDEAIGFITRGRGVTVHRIDCVNILNMTDDERLINVEWQSNTEASFSAKILVEGNDNSGILGDLARIFSDEKISVHALNAKSGDNNIAYYDIVVEVKSRKELSDLITKIKKLKNVIKVTRL